MMQMMKISLLFACSEENEKSKNMNDNYFILSVNTRIEYSADKDPVKNAIDILNRDIKAICQQSLEENKITLVKSKELRTEQYLIEVESNLIRINANSDLGFVYGLLRISKDFLGIPPFWFWMEKKPEKKDYVKIPLEKIVSPNYAVKYRGWFFNDEVLMLGWKYNEQDKAGWKMCFETLLRCGGNMTIPGTDKMARENALLAAQYGLTITHHHAEPLGAQMFLRAYPDLEPDYFEHPDLFKKLWIEAVDAQKDINVVWNLCFRGQGDYPFWAKDKSGKYDTDEKRGKAISEIIKIQADIVKAKVNNPVFCMNLYGEIMELYYKGFIELPENVILVKADNGFGKMVTRRMDTHNPRIDAMPKKNSDEKQGIYYHVSFYDLMAANQLSMFPNSVNFVSKELSRVLENHGDEFWVINCSNVKPHTYFLDAISRIWMGEIVDDESQSKLFASDYFNGNKTIAECYKEYANITPAFGLFEDEHGGEQLYTENIRYFAHYCILQKNEAVPELVWLLGEQSLANQLEKFRKLCEDKLGCMERLYAKVPEAAVTLKLHVLMQLNGAKGAIEFGRAYEKYLDKDYRQAFFLLGKSAELFDKVDMEMKASVNDIWSDFYDNDCQADYKFTAYQIRKFMGVVRELGDNPAHYRWQWDYLYSKEDREVHLILLDENHATDQVIFEQMKKESNTCNEF